MPVSCRNDSQKSWGVTFLAQKLPPQPTLWRWLMFNTHFSWQHQKGTQRVKQIYLACFEASSELALKLFSMQLPAFVWLCNLYHKELSFYLSVCQAQSAHTVSSVKHMVFLTHRFPSGYSKLRKVKIASLFGTCLYIHKHAFICIVWLFTYNANTIAFIPWLPWQ